MPADDKIQPTADGEPDHSTFTTTPNDLDPGLTTNLVEVLETPKMFIRRVLIEGEEVVSTFDVKFPGEFLPMWQIVTYCIASLGLYGFCLLFRFIRRCMYRCRICTPNVVHFAFGKMAVTNKGRIICWKEEVYQKKVPQNKCNWLGFCIKCCCEICWPGLCQAPVIYAYGQESRMYRIADIKQITQFMTSEAAAIFCCLDYSCGIEVRYAITCQCRLQQYRSP